MPGDEGLLDPSEVETLIGSTEGGTAKGDSTPKVANPGEEIPAAEHLAEISVSPYKLEELGSSEEQRNPAADIGLILDVDLNVRVELGRARMYIEDVLRLREGSIVPLEKLAGDPVDIFVNGRLMGRGEVLVLNDNFCVRISEILGEQSETGVAGE